MKSPLPKCFGHLFSPSDSQCCACLLNEQCSLHTFNLQQTKGAEKEEQVSDKPKTVKNGNRKSLILKICHKYGISTIHVGRDGTEYEVREETLWDYTSIDHLLLRPEALHKLLGDQ